MHIRAARHRRGVASRMAGLAPFRLRFAAAAMAAMALLTLSVPAQDPPVVPAAGTDGVVRAKFTDLHWRVRGLAAFGEPAAFVVYFATVECPMVARGMPKLGVIAADYAARDVVTIVMNTGAGDSFVDAAAQAVAAAPQARFGKDFELAFARDCGVDRTNTVVVIDRQHRVRYRGRIDDQEGYTATRAQPSRADLRAAIEDVLANRPVAVRETDVSGCRMTLPRALDLERVPTYGRDIAPIVARTCKHCHFREPAGGITLAGLADLQEHAAMIAEVVGNGRMPPWRAAGSGVVFQNHRALSASDRETVRAWLLAGLPRGEWNGTLHHPMEMPWRIGSVSLVLEAPEAIAVAATGSEPYRCFTLPHGFGAETWVEAIDVKSQHPRAMQHCSLAIVPAGQGFDPARIVANFTSHGSALQLPAGTALRIPVGSVLVGQVYYEPIGRALVDRLQVALRFPGRTVQAEARVTNFGSADFEIPAQAAAHAVEVASSLPVDASGLGVFVHMHGRGRDVTLVAQSAGAEPETLLTVPAYDYRAQETYWWRTGTRSFAAGTELRALAHFDNSGWNPANPDPSRAVRCGSELGDEQLRVVLLWSARDAQLAIAVDPATGVRAAPAPAPAASK
jgi:Redoxin